MTATATDAVEYGTDEIDTERYTEARHTGEVVSESGYHQPNARHTAHCGCKNDTRKGAYRDVEVKMPDGRAIYYYHQSPVVVRKGPLFRLDNCGYMTRTTKERINRHLPYGWRLIQRDYEWFIVTPDGEEIDFDNGMIIHA